MPPRDAEIDAAREEGRKAGMVEGRLESLCKVVAEQTKQIDALFNLQRECLAKNCEPVKGRLGIVEEAVKEIPDLSRKMATLWVVALVIVFALGAFGSRIVTAIWPEHKSSAAVETKAAGVTLPSPAASHSVAPNVAGAQ